MYARRVYAAAAAAVLFMWTGFFIPLAAQSSDGWYYNTPVKLIEFEGLNNISSVDLEGITAPYINQPFTDELYMEILNRLYSLDYFNTIEPEVSAWDAERSGCVLRFVITERPVVSKILFTGNRSVRSVELQDAVSLKVKDIYSASKLLVDERAIRDAYLKKGFTGVRVTSEAVETDSGVEVTFHIQEGKATVITAITFQGNQVVTEKTLRGQLTLKEAGLFNKGAFQEAQLEVDRQVIETYYHDRGYADAAVLDVIRTTTYNEEENRDELTLEFVIQEGSQYTFGGITFEGNTIFTDEELRSLIGLQDNAVYNQTRFMAGCSAVADLYYENGYTGNGFMPDIQKDPSARTISCTFSIIERPRSHIQNIIIQGNEKTKDYVIRRELLVEPGDIYSKTKIVNSLRNLFNLQYFSAVVPEIMPGSEDYLSDLVITVAEQSTTSIEFGLTFSGISDPDALPISLFAKWEDRNIFGTGRTVGANVMLSTEQQSLGVSYGDNWLFGIPLSFSVGAEVSHSKLTSLQTMFLPDGIDQENYYFDYEQWAFTFSAGVGRRWQPTFAILTVSGGLNSTLMQNIYDADMYEPYDSTIAEYHGSWGLQNSIYGAVALDDRDINYDPSNGWFLKNTLSWYGLIPTVENEFFFRNKLQGELYFTLLNVPVFESWSLKAVLALFSSIDMQLPPNMLYKPGFSNQLYIDGMFIGRGWNAIYNKHRGMAQWNNTVELRIPIVPNILAFDGFFDAVAITDTAADMFSALSVEDWYFSWGIGLRFSMPQFPLRLLLAWPFKVEDGSVQWLNTSEDLVDKIGAPTFVLSFNMTAR
ncbi:MAG TPA: outer membrane protein assembly factor BamA [Candidatus Treponema faecavium]|nr:outer membrane protein assembly factor BamA [Candidatus Treponema faecavium]